MRRWVIVPGYPNREVEQSEIRLEHPPYLDPKTLEPRGNHDQTNQRGEDGPGNRNGISGIAGAPDRDGCCREDHVGDVLVGAAWALSSSLFLFWLPLAWWLH